MTPDATPAPAPRRLIALAGPPGGGKSTLAPLIAAHLGAVVVPMDGFHLDNALLDAAGLRPRKGAPETFDTAGLRHALRRLRSGEAEVILPAFDRARDAAIAGAIRVTSADRLLLVEGNYLLSTLPGWADLAPLWEASVLLSVPRPELERRLTDRWTGLGLDDATVRARLGNDLANADAVARTSGGASLHMEDDPAAPEVLAARIAGDLRAILG